MSVTDAARRFKVTRVALSRILNGRSAISPDMALRLAAMLGTTAEIWIGLQAQNDLWVASRHEIAPSSEIEGAVPVEPFKLKVSFNPGD